MKIVDHFCERFRFSARRRRAGLLLLGLLAVWCLPAIRLAHASNLPTGFVEQTVTGPWVEPVGVTFDDNARMYVWDRSGKIWSRDNGSNSWTLMIDISEEVGAWDDFGLLGFTLDPDFLVNGNIYLMYVVDRHYLMNFGT